MVEFEAMSGDQLDSALLLSKLETAVLGREMRVYDSVSSTQDEARQWVTQGAPHGALILAEEQTSGRGRLGRLWHSPKGKGVWMSIVLKSDTPFLYPPQLTLLSAVALCRAVRILTGLDVGIKWPNDLLIGEKKVSGILLESVETKAKETVIVAGIGISVNLLLNDYPESLKLKATSLKIESGKTIDRQELIVLFLKQFEDLFELYLREGFSPILTLWEAHSLTLNREVSLRTPKGILTGLAVRLDDTGALILRASDGNEQKVFSGDIIF